VDVRAKSSSTQRGGAAAAALTLALLTGCISDAQGVRAVPVSSGTAAASVSAYRAQNGRGAVTANMRLNAIAARQALAMARQGRLSHSLAGSLQKRLKNGGYVWLVAVENISAGRDTFDEALAGWSTSAGHRANLLNSGVTQIGVGAAHADDRYGSYWALILAAPETGGGTGPVTAGG
jgi:uncharacterized protein YkwD